MVVVGVVVVVVDVGGGSECSVGVQVGPQLSVELELPAAQPTASELQVPAPVCDRVDLMGDAVGCVVGSVVDSPHSSLELEGDPVPHSHPPPLPGGNHGDSLHCDCEVQRVNTESRNAADEY